MIMALNWDRHLEDEWFERVEEMVREQLTITEDLPERWRSLPSLLAHMIGEISPAPPESFVVDAVATTLGLLIGSWKRYVDRFIRTASPDRLLEGLQSRPRLEDFLQAIQWPFSKLNTHPSLALSDLQERLVRGEGGKSEEYLQRFGVTIRQPQFACFVTIRELENRAFTSGETLPAFGSFIVGRQRKHSGEPEPVCFVEGTAGNRLVVAGKNQAAHCSREQLLVNVLTPNYIYVKNISDVITVKVQATSTEDGGGEVVEEWSELRPSLPLSNTLECGAVRVLRIPFSILLPTKVLCFSNP